MNCNYSVEVNLPKKPIYYVVVQEYTYHGLALKGRGNRRMESGARWRERVAGNVTAEGMKLLPARFGWILMVRIEKNEDEEEDEESKEIRR